MAGDALVFAALGMAAGAQKSLDRITGISVTKAPAKTAYVTGESFDPTGMEVTVTYKTHATKTVTNYTYTTRALTAADTSVSIQYSEGGVTAAVNYPISVDGAYGVMWDYGNSSTALTRLTAATDPNGYVTASVTTAPSPAVGTGAGSSPFDTLYPWSGMDEYNIIDGEVAFRKGETGFSRGNHDTMVYIPEFYYKIVDDSTNSKRYFYVAPRAKTGFTKHPGSGRYVGRYNTISGYASKTGVSPLGNVSRATARTGSHAKGDKWRQYDFASWCAVWLLYLVEFADWDSQGKIGLGIVNTTASSAVGGTDAMAYHTGRAAGTDGLTAVQYRHIENPWGNIWEWIDGINFTNGASYVCLDPSKYADATTTNYTSTGITVPGGSGLYTKSLGYASDAEYAFLPTAGGGSASTYITDALYTGTTGNQNLYVGGGYNSGLSGGLLCFDSNIYSEDLHPAIGTRLMYIP